MRRFTVWSLVVALMATMLAATALANDKGEGPKSLGKTTLDSDVGWVIGSGQFDGEFIVAEKQGVVIGLRAQERFEGPLDVTGAKGNRVGVYQAATGTTGSAADNLGTWNYDFHVDISGATGNAKDRDLSDYRLVLEQDFTDQSLFGALGSDPVVLPMGPEVDEEGVCARPTAKDEHIKKCQQSWNPGFGNSDYDPDAAGTYNLRLVLTPETFSGPPIAVAIQVVVS